MKPIFPIIDNSITNNNKAMKKIKKLKLNSKERLILYYIIHIF